MAKLYQNSLEGFLYEGLGNYEIHLLIDGPLNNLATWQNTTETWDWPSTSLWYHNQNRVNSQGKWSYSVNSVVANSGTLQEGSIVGIAISAIPISGSKDTLTALEMADRLRMSVDFGTNHQNFNIKVTNKRLENEFVYLEVEKVPITPELGAAIGVYFKDYYHDNQHTYWGYTCYPKNNNEVTISLYPYTPPVESEEYNPTVNNVNTDRQGTIARLVEEFELKNTLVGSLEDAQNIYNGWFSPWNSSVQASQSINGSSSYGTRPTSGGTTGDAGGATGIYQLLPLAYVEKATTFADIPDSFYSSIANISGRWLGTKNAEYHIYLGDKLWFTNRNILECKQDIQQNVDKGIRLVYQDSPCIFDKVNNANLKAAVSGSIKGTVESGSLISGSLDGFLNGKISGTVTKVNLVNQAITYYSSSVKAKNHTIWTEAVPVTVQGSGTFVHSSWAKVQSGSTVNVLSSELNVQGLEKFNGRCIFPEYTSSYQTFTSEFDTVSGSIKSWGRIQGIGQVNYIPSTGSVVNVGTILTPVDTEEVAEEAAIVDLWGSVINSGQSQQFTDYNHLYLKNINFDKLRVGSVLTGSLQIIPAGSVYVSGTLGASEKKFTLHTFDGTLDVRNRFIQNVRFDHADADGVILNNIETARQAITILNAFTADSIAVAPDFGGSVGVDITNGQINVTSDREIYLSIVTEDQETISGTSPSSTGSLPNAVAKFMEINSGIPIWNFSDVRKDIVGTIVGGIVQQQDYLAEGTALLSGSLANFEIKGTRKVTKVARYLKITGSFIPQSDIQQAVMLLDDLRTGLAFAQAAYARSGSSGYVTSSYVTPKVLDNAIMPEKTFEAMMTASKYTVPGTLEPVWPLSGSIPSGSVSRKFNFYTQDQVERGKILNYISGSRKAITRLENYLSGSYYLNDQFKNQAGQYTYVYLRSTTPAYLQANITDFSGSYINTIDSAIVSQSNGPLSGSYRQIWGRFGEGLIKGHSFKSSIELPKKYSSSDELKSYSNSWKTRQSSDIVGVVYGAFDYQGYLDGGFEGNMVEGVVEGDMSGLLSGIVSRGIISGGPVQLQGVNRGAFTGSVTAGTFNGVMKDLSITGNNLTNNLVFEGQFDTTEEFPLHGILSGSVQNISLPDRCAYEMTGSAFDNQQIDLHIPKKGFMTGKLEMPIEAEEGWEDRPVSSATVLNLTGNSIKISGSFPGEVSGSLIFGTEGKLALTKRAESNWSASIATDWSSLSGQFEISGSGILLNTPENSPFSGKISPINVNQNVTGSFDVVIEDSTYLDLRMNGSLENFTGHVLVQGLVDIESGSKGNLVEGHDRPFFTLQTFSGSIFPEDTTLEAVENMSISDMVMDNLRFTSGMALVGYSTGSFGIVKEHEYVRNTLTLPQIGDVVYMSAGNQARVVSAKLYCPDLNALLTVNDRGTVVREEYLTQIQ